MKALLSPTLLLVLSLLIPSSGIAELTAAWNGVVIHTRRPDARIVAEVDAGQLSKLALTTGKNTCEVPPGRTETPSLPPTAHDPSQSLGKSA